MLSLPLTALIGVWLAAAPAEAVAVPFKDGYPETRRDRLYPLSEVKEGDRGIGYTVFRGHEVKPFSVEILGVLNGMLGPHQHVILARLTGPEIEFTGVVSGMSGSPVYIGDRLLGAVSYRFGAFTKEPIAGITPIASMLGIYGEAGAIPEKDRRASTTSLPPPRTRDMPTWLPLPAAVFAGGREDDPRPIATPISLSGFSPDVAEALKGELTRAGLFAVIGGGGGGPGAKEHHRSPRESGRTEDNSHSVAGGVRSAPIAPGAPIAAVLMRGDITVTGVGTVTFVDGKTVLGFGHPFFGYGHVAFPMATASVLNTLASAAGSYKQAAAALEVGALSHDRLTAIGGEIGQIAPMIPTRIRVFTSNDKKRVSIDTAVEIVDHEVWLPTMVQAAIASAAQGRLGTEAGGTVDMTARLVVEDRALEVKDSYAAPAPTQVGQFVARDVAILASIVQSTHLIAAHIRRIDVELETRPEIEVAYLEDLLPDRTEVKAGETISVSARLRPHRGTPERVSLRFLVPKDAREEVEIYAGGSVEVDRREAKVTGDRIPVDLDDLLAVLQERRPGRGLYGRMILTRPGLRQDAELMSSLPLSQRMVLAEESGVRQKVVTEALGPVGQVPYTRIVFGGQSVKIRVVP